MRVLHVHSGHAWGALEATLVTLARSAELAPAMQPEFALCVEGRLRRELESAGAPVSVLGSVGPRAPGSIVRARRGLRRLLAVGHYELVVCHSAWAQAVFGGVPRTLGIPEVFHLHDRVHHYHWVERWAARHPPDWSLADSEFTRAGLAGLFAIERSSVVYPPVEPRGAPFSAEERRRARAELGFDDETVVIVQPGPLAPANGHARLLRALARLPPPTSWFCLVLAGGGGRGERAYRRTLEEQARELGVTARLRFVDEPDDPSPLLAAADVHCQPNVEPEPFGIALVRSLEAGLPVVTSDMGGPRELVTDEVGVLVRDEAKLAAALETLVRDAELRRRLGAGGPARARELCDPAVRVPELASVLERVTRMPRLGAPRS